MPIQNLFLRGEEIFELLGDLDGQGPAVFGQLQFFSGYRTIPLRVENFDLYLDPVFLPGAYGFESETLVYVSRIKPVS